MPLNKQEREEIANKTIARSPGIVAEHKAQGASEDCVFIQEQLPALDPAACPNPEHVPAAVEIINADAFTVARNILAADSDGKVAVLNLASDILPAGPWLQVFTTTQVRDRRVCSHIS